MILDEIVAATRQRLEETRPQRSLAALEEAIGRHQRPPQDFARALQGPGISLIAEVKRASPSKGPLRPDLDAAALARTYERSGAAAISVLTEPRYFRGSLSDLGAVRGAVGLPVLCKDFILDTYQVYQARAHGADAVLLITAILSPHELVALARTAEGLGMTPLVEVHDAEELRRAGEMGPRVIGINNRSLQDFSVDLETTLRLLPLVPPGTVVVSESGIHDRADVERLEGAGVHAILVGEALVTAPDPGVRIAELLGLRERV